MIQKYALLGFLLMLVVASCEVDISREDSSGDTSVGGSLASFAISGNYLYTINDQQLVTYDISNPENTITVEQVYVYDGSETKITNLETIFPYGDYLFLGANDGMYIIDITTKSSPQFVSCYEHVVSCDPVVVQDSIAYVTLRKDNSCFQETNELHVVDISDLENPKEIKTYYNFEAPYGLGISGDMLFICDNNMLKVFDCSDPEDISIIDVFDNITATDVIPTDTLLMVLGESELTQFSYSPGTNTGEGNLTCLSSISN